MEQVKVSDTAVATKMIGCTPQELRAIADMMEKAGTTALPGSTVTYPISKTVTLLFRVPEVNFKFVKSDMRDSEQQLN